MKFTTYVQFILCKNKHDLFPEQERIVNKEEGPRPDAIQIINLAILAGLINEIKDKVTYMKGCSFSFFFS